MALDVLAAFTLGKISQYPLHRRLGGHYSHCRNSDEEKILRPSRN
jgi:hypothetical protein